MRISFREAHPTLPDDPAQRLSILFGFLSDFRPFEQLCQSRLVPLAGQFHEAWPIFDEVIGLNSLLLTWGSLATLNNLQRQYWNDIVSSAAAAAENCTWNTDKEFYVGLFAKLHIFHQSLELTPEVWTIRDTIAQQIIELDTQLLLHSVVQAPAVQASTISATVKDPDERGEFSRGCKRAANSFLEDDPSEDSAD